MKKIIQRDRSVIPACDVSLEVFEEIVKATKDIEKIGGYKIGPALCGRPGYDKIVSIAREYTDKPLIFDAQKWGTDIPDTAKPILTPLKESGIDAVILFPQSGPVTEYEWIKTAQELELGVIVGGEMTHPGYMEGDDLNAQKKGTEKTYAEIFKELGLGLPDIRLTGFIREFAPADMYIIAAKLGVTDFVVPGNKPEMIKQYKAVIESRVAGASYYSPGLVAQGGDISEGAKAAGERYHAIVGRGISKSPDKRKAAEELTSKL
jgi:orotidine-5'-phosphate decarboxylase